jgi:hypothetical protein
MYKGCCDQDACAEVLSTKQECRRDAKTGKLDYEDWKSASSRRNKQDNEKASNMQSKVVIGLRRSSLASAPASQAVNRRMTCITSAQTNTPYIKLQHPATSSIC